MKPWFGLLALTTAAGSCGCATVIVPPRHPPAPAPVFLMVHDWHASLVFSNQSGALTSYSYGDWRWTAGHQRNLFTGIAALAWPTRAALERRELTSLQHGAVGRAADRVYEIQVASPRAKRLQSQLDTLCEQSVHARVRHAGEKTIHVLHPQAYTARNNSNRAVADWLTELGCNVRPRCTLMGRWTIRPAEPNSTE